MLSRRIVADLREHNNGRGEMCRRLCQAAGDAVRFVRRVRKGHGGIAESMRYESRLR